MTLQELYQTINGDYEQAMRVLRMEKLMDKHIRKLTKNGVVDALTEQGLTKATCGDLEKHAYSVNDAIADPELRNLHIFAAV